MINTTQKQKDRIEMSSYVNEIGNMSLNKTIRRGHEIIKVMTDYHLIHHLFSYCTPDFVINYRQQLPFDISNEYFFDQAIVDNQAQVARWCLHYCPPKSISTLTIVAHVKYLVKEKCTFKEILVLEFIVSEDMEENYWDVVLETAITHGQLTIVKEIQLQGKVNKLMSAKVLEALTCAVANGHWVMVRYCYSKGMSLPNSVGKQLIITGNFETAKYLDDNGIEWSRQVFPPSVSFRLRGSESDSEDGAHLKTLKYLSSIEGLQSKLEHLTLQIMIAAIRKDLWDVVNYLFFKVMMNEYPESRRFRSTILSLANALRAKGPEFRCYCPLKEKAYCELVKFYNLNYHGVVGWESIY